MNFNGNMGFGFKWRNNSHNRATNTGSSTGAPSADAPPPSNGLQNAACIDDAQPPPYSESSTPTEGQQAAIGDAQATGAEARNDRQSIAEAAAEAHIASCSGCCGRTVYPDDPDPLGDGIDMGQDASRFGPTNRGGPGNAGTSDKTVRAPTDMQLISTVPWPGNKYLIVEKISQKAVTITKRGLVLEAIDTPPSVHQRNHWVCVEHDNRLVFYESGSRRMLGYVKNAHCWSSHAPELQKESDYRINADRFDIENGLPLWPRPHPEGGFQLLAGTTCRYSVGLTNAGEHLGLFDKEKVESIPLWLFVQV